MVQHTDRVVLLETPQSGEGCGVVGVKPQRLGRQPQSGVLFQVPHSKTADRKGGWWRVWGGGGEKSPRGGPPSPYNIKAPLSFYSKDFLGLGLSWIGTSPELSGPAFRPEYFDLLCSGTPHPFWVRRLLFHPVQSKHLRLPSSKPHSCWSVEHG